METTVTFAAPKKNNPRQSRVVLGRTAVDFLPRNNRVAAAREDVHSADELAFS